MSVCILTRVINSCGQVAIVAPRGAVCVRHNFESQGSLLYSLSGCFNSSEPKAPYLLPECKVVRHQRHMVDTIS